MNTTNNTVSTLTAPAPFKFNKPGKLGFAPLSALFISPTNRQCLGINPAHVEGLAISIKKEGWIGTSVLEILPTGEVKSGNHRFLAAQLAGYEGEVPYMVIDPKKASEEDIQIRAYAQNISLGNSPLETSLLVGDLSRKGMKNKAIAARLFASKKGAETIVSQHLSFIRDCPPWLVSAIEDGKISYSAAKALLGDKGLEGMRGEIEGRTPENPWVKVKSLSIPTPTPTPAESTPAQTEVKDSKESPTPTTEPAPSTPTPLVASGDVPASVVFVSPNTPSLGEVKPNPELAIPAPAPVAIITLESIAEMPLTQAVERLLEIKSPEDAQKLDALLAEKYGREALDAEVDSQDGEASKVDIAPTPSTQNNPKTERKGMVSIRKTPSRVRALARELSGMLATLPVNEVGGQSEWVDKNCYVTADGRAVVRIMLEGKAYLLTLGEDCVG